MIWIRKLVTYSIILCLISACTGQGEAIPEGYYPYEKDEVKQAVESLSFQPELPSYVPILAEVLVTDQFYIGETEAFDISLFTVENDILTIQMINDEMAVNEDKANKVEMNGNIPGYYVNEKYSKKLTWEKAGITYEITYRASEKELDKRDFIQVANSFRPH
ncbi:hypothetical protein [Gracilibacillus sp. YIM 98692]|uniref:hypothetical protein n=1 Tax=Gracilibacillus sp. YIM 98692 TaxID=2663532 RepID=UPI0013D8C938|nr:hypothetical protein [Gracilibacillus sp. YIM 98692]